MFHCQFFDGAPAQSGAVILCKSCERNESQRESGKPGGIINSYPYIIYRSLGWHCLHCTLCGDGHSESFTVDVFRSPCLSPKIYCTSISIDLVAVILVEIEFAGGSVEACQFTMLQQPDAVICGCAAWIGVLNNYLYAGDDFIGRNVELEFCYYKIVGVRTYLIAEVIEYCIRIVAARNIFSLLPGNIRTREFRSEERRVGKECRSW